MHLYKKSVRVARFNNAHLLMKNLELAAINRDSRFYGNLFIATLIEMRAIKFYDTSMMMMRLVSF